LQLFSALIQIKIDRVPLLIVDSTQMDDESLARVMAILEKKVGKERVSVIRREAKKRGVSVLTVLGDAVMKYTKRKVEVSS
jgi:hypothetical protein